MYLDENVRWKFRYSGTFRHLFPEFLDIVNKYSNSHNGIYSREVLSAFVILFENVIRVIRDYLRYEGIFQVGMVKVLKEIFYVEIISDGQAWIDMMFEVDNINKNGFENFKWINEDFLKKRYLPALNELYVYFEQRMGEDE